MCVLVTHGAVMGKHVHEIFLPHSNQIRLGKRSTGLLFNKKGYDRRLLHLVPIDIFAKSVMLQASTHTNQYARLIDLWH